MISRRSLIKNSILGMAGACAVHQNLYGRQPANIEPTGIKITNVKPYVFRKATFVKIETNAGISGWGEGDHDHPELIAAVINEICKELVIGHDPFDTEYLWMQMYFKGEDAGTTGLLPGAIAGVDNALWDLKGKILNLPVHKISGASRIDKVRVYGSFGRSGGKYGQKNPAEMAATAAEYVDQGYKTIKARMQIRQLNVDPDPDPTYDIVKEIRKVIGDEIELFVDFNNGYTPAKAITVAKKLYEHFNIAAVEEPVSYHNYPGLCQVVEALDIPVMAGEHEFNKWQMRDLMLIGKVDIINADCIKCAGFSENRKIAAMAHAFDKTIMTHNTRPMLATAASLQLIASIPNAARVQEYAGKRPELGLNHLFENYFEYKDGYLSIPQEPGMGLVVNEKAMEETKLN
ncbi:mandelate racemase/muconate lactonizing enzyme family protein [candidate division KSB1 bacterium]|nr:mandelate racemase/muconate lactonizing enzyme family protein [candidate division KSB1 bacterium]